MFVSFRLFPSYTIAHRLVLLDKSFLVLFSLCSSVVMENQASSVSPFLQRLEADFLIRQQMKRLEGKKSRTPEEQDRLVELTYTYYVLNADLRDIPGPIQ